MRIRTRCRLSYSNSRIRSTRGDHVPATLGVQWGDGVAVSDTGEAALAGLSTRLGSAMTPTRKSAANVPILSHINFSSTNKFSMLPQFKRRSGVIAEVT